MKTWLITGCSSGFGKALAKHVLAQGDAVIATARKPETLQDLEGEVLALKLDVTDKQNIKEAVAKAKEWKGRIDVLVNNAGFGNVGSVEQTADATWKRLYDVNVFGIINMLQEVLPVMRAQQSGHVLNVSSVAGLLAMPGFGAYCSTKYAVEGLSEALAAEVQPLGIKVTIIEPGAFRTDFVGNVAEDPFGEEYAPTVGETAKMLQNMTEGAMGDPHKAAIAMYNITQESAPPVRLLLGKDAYGWALPKLKQMVADMEKYEAISTSTDFDEIAQ